MNGKNHTNVTNTDQGELHLYRGQNIGVVDLRSAGYPPITRTSIQRCLHERFIFISEEELQDYVSSKNTTNDKTPPRNTSLDIRKTSLDETEKSPRQSKYCKVNTKKDPYPWLDENDPRRHMTGKEIQESTIDFSKACIAERQKQVLYKIVLKYRKAFSIRDEIGIMSKYGSKIGIK